MNGHHESAVTFTARERAELVPAEPDEAPLGPREVAGRTLATLISAGTELADGYLGEQFPRRPGYAAAFEVQEVGAEVTSVQPGDLAFCMGRHQSWQRAPEDRVLAVPAGLPAASATFARLMGVTMSTLTTTTARPPEPVLVTGLGLVGHLGARIFDRCGYQVAACDPDARRREIAIRAGILRVVATMEELGDLAGRVGLALECSGHEQAVLEACQVVRKRGEIALVGAHWRQRADVTAHEILRLVFFNYIVLRSGWEWELPLQPTDYRAGSIFGNYRAALDWLADGRIQVDGLYSLVSPGDAQQAYQDLLHQRSERLAVVFDWAAL